MHLDQFNPDAYVQSATGNPAEGNQFFQPYLIHFENPWDVISTGRSLLHKCHNADPVAYDRIYKGWIYFYLGLASFLLQDYEIAFFFIDNAVASDLYKFNPVTNPSHAMRFFQIDSNLQELTDGNLSEVLGFYKVVEAKIESTIQVYNSRSKSEDINLPDLRKNFLQPAMSVTRPNWRTLSTTFFSFCLDWNDRDELFTLCPEPSTSEPYFLHLFKGCLLFESLLKENPTKKPPPEKDTLNKVLKHLHKELGIPEKLDTYHKTLKDVLDELDKSDNSIEQSILVACMTRNTLGHNLWWEDVSLNKSQYQQLFEMVASSCLHVIACLYK